MLSFSSVESPNLPEYAPYFLLPAVKSGNIPAILEGLVYA